MQLAGKVNEIEHDFRNTSYLNDETSIIENIKRRLSCRPETEKSDKHAALLYYPLLLYHHGSPAMNVWLRAILYTTQLVVQLC